jgi:predicted phage terminase large subunit-like protein
MQAICDHLEAVTRGEITHLLINIPPGCSKSLLVSVYWPAWEWLHNPELQYVAASGNPTVVTRDALRMRDVVESSWYRETFRPTWGMDRTQNEKTHFLNTEKGGRQSISTMQKITGLRGDRVLVDDPTDARTARDSPHLLARHAEWFDDSLSDRTNLDTTTRFVVIMQRLHEADLSGHILADEEQEYVHLCLPAEYDPEYHCTTPIFSDPRTEKGELLAPEVLSAAKLARIKRKKGPDRYLTQYQQRPTAPDGAVFRRENLRYWSELPEEFDLVIASFDSTFKKTKDSHYVVGQVWGKKGPDFYMLPFFFRERTDVSGHIEAIREAKRQFPQIRAILVEGTGNGPAVVTTLSREISGVIGVELPKDSKLGRAHAVTPLFQAGNVYLPPPELYSWVGYVYRPELLGFPRARFDDQVDATTQALDYFAEDDDPWVY